MLERIVLEEEEVSKKILLVDNKDDEIRILRRRLCQFGFDVVIAEGPMRAIDILSKDKDIELIFLDFNTLNLTGFQIINKIAKMNPAQKAKVIVQCNGCSITQLRNIIKCGASDCLIKPVDQLVLQHKVSSILGLDVEKWMDYTINEFDTDKVAGVFLLSDNIELMSLSELNLKFKCRHDIEVGSKIILRVPILDEIGVGECLVEIISVDCDGHTNFCTANIIGLEEAKRTQLRKYILECYRKKRKVKSQGRLPNC